MSVKSVLVGEKVSCEFVDVREACSLLERNEGASWMQQGALSARLVNCEERGQVVLIEGGNGEFMIVKP